MKLFQFEVVVYLCYSFSLFSAVTIREQQEVWLPKIEIY